MCAVTVAVERAVAIVNTIKSGKASAKRNFVLVEPSIFVVEVLVGTPYALHIATITIAQPSS